MGRHTMRALSLTVLAVVIVCGFLTRADAARWYVDATKTGGSNTGVDTTNAWTSITSAAGSSGFAPGDTIFVHADHAETMANSQLNWSDDGTATSPIVVYGDDGTVWSYTHADSLPIFDFNAGSSAEWYFFIDEFWSLERLHFYNAGAQSSIYFRDGGALWLKDCKFEKAASSSDYHVQMHTAIGYVEGCTFDGNDLDLNGTNNGVGIYSTGRLEVKNSSFDGFYSAITIPSNNARLDGSSFGVTESNTSDFTMTTGCIRGFQNTFSTWPPSWNDVVNGEYNKLFSLSNQNVDGSGDLRIHYQTLAIGAESNRDSSRAGGGDYAMEVTKDTYAIITPVDPVELATWTVPGTASTSVTYTCYVKRDATWTIDAATELFLEATYVGGSDVVTYSQSTEAISADWTWTALTLAVNPNRTGPVELRLMLAEADGDNNGLMYFDPLLIDSTSDEMELNPRRGLPDLAFVPAAILGSGTPFEVRYRLRGGVWFQDGDKKRQIP